MAPLPSTQGPPTFPLDETVVSFWTWRADYQRDLAAYHMGRGETVRAIDCLVKSQSLADKFADPQRSLNALFALIDATLLQNSPADTTTYVQRLLGQHHSDIQALAPFLARLDRVLEGMDPAQRLPCSRRVLDLARPEPELYALTCLSLARFNRTCGSGPAAALNLLDKPLRWAEKNGEQAAQVALRSEQAACLLAQGRREEAIAALEANVRQLETTQDCPPGMLATAQRNLAVARG